MVSLKDQRGLARKGLYVSDKLGIEQARSLDSGNGKLAGINTGLQLERTDLVNHAAKSSPKGSPEALACW
jgi:hypothetical protein